MPAAKENCIMMRVYRCYVILTQKEKLRLLYQYPHLIVPKPNCRRYRLPQTVGFRHHQPCTFRPHNRSQFTRTFPHQSSIRLYKPNLSQKNHSKWKNNTIWTSNRSNNKNTPLLSRKVTKRMISSFPTNNC
jgi:hypothetical protein